MKTKRRIINVFSLLVCLFTIKLMTPSIVIPDSTVMFASTPNPVGSGARAIGMGGAFIGIADDATSASWNTGGLPQLDFPEFSIVYTYSHIAENLFPSISLGANGKQSVDNKDLNYFSLSYVFKFMERANAFSLNYQNLYNFNKEWDFPIRLKQDSNIGIVDFTGQQRFVQDGGLSALGLAWAIQWTQKLSFGFTLNVWDDNLCNNKWKEENILHDCVISSNIFGENVTYPYETEITKDNYSFDGVNFNLGVLFRPKEDFTIGFVYKSPFKADIDHRHFEKNQYTNEKENMKMPASFGIGVSYNFPDVFKRSGDNYPDEFKISADIYHTQWQNYINIDAYGKEKSPVSNLTVSQSNVKPTTQIRLGAEYLWIQRQFMVPFRMGLFYDPAPSNGSPDTYWGFSLGSGLKKDYFSFDIAYQARFGNDVGDSIIPGYDFKMDVEEHQVFCSFIFYLTKDKKDE